MLKGIVLGGGAVFGGQWALENNIMSGIEVPSVPDLGGGPPPTENKIGSISDSGYYESSIRSITFYESGAAEITFRKGHGWDRFSVTHNSLHLFEDAFEVWQAPTYRGPVVTDMKSVIQSHAPYPNNAFKMGVYYNPNEELYIGAEEFEFSVPESYLEG